MARPAPSVKSKVVEEPTFTWVGTDRRGQRMKGELRAATANVVRAEIRRQGITPVRVRKKPKPLFSFDSVKPKDIALFTRQLHTMLGAGIPLAQAIDMVAQTGRNEKLRKLLQDIRTDVESGSSLSAALAKHPRHFDELYCKMVHAGEESGVLENILGRLASQLEKIEAIKSKIKKAMMYPAFVVATAVGVTFFMMVFVIPVFENLFQSFGANLPAFTQMVIDISDDVRRYWWLVLGIMLAAGFAFFAARRQSRQFRYSTDWLLMRIPIFGHLVLISAMARFTRTLATMFESGVPLVESLTSVAGTIGNQVYERAILEMRNGVSIGQQLHFTLRQSNLFTNMVVQMVAIGEDAGSLGSMLNKAADYYEEELDTTVTNLMTLIEPMVIVILGLTVGSLVVAMYLPIFKLGMAM